MLTGHGGGGGGGGVGEWSAYVAEMRGVADGAGVGFEDILALNVRTEIAYGMGRDGCTAFSWREKGEGVGEERSFLVQNWDVCLSLAC